MHRQVSSGHLGAVHSVNFTVKLTVLRMGSPVGPYSGPLRKIIIVVFTSSINVFLLGLTIHHYFLSDLLSILSSLMPIWTVFTAERAGCMNHCT